MKAATPSPILDRFSERFVTHSATVRFESGANLLRDFADSPVGSAFGDCTDCTGTLAAMKMCLVHSVKLREGFRR